MKHLVSGGAGFLGSHLIDKLIEKGDQVICIDNFITGKRNNLSRWEGDSYLEIINHDVIEPYNIGIDLDMIWNLACPASPHAYQRDPIKTSRTSFLGTYNLLELAKEKNAIFLMASTSEIYGDPIIHPQVENYRGNVNPIGKRSCYDEGKRIAETLCFDYYRLYDIKIRVARIFNTYGPRMQPDDGRVISNLICQALDNKDLTIYGDGKQTRSFCYVEDLIDGLIKLMYSEHQGPINIGNPKEFTILELAELIKGKTNLSPKLVFKDLPEDDPKQRKPSISLAKKLLNWEPKINLNDGLNNTIKYFKEELKDG